MGEMSKSPEEIKKDLAAWGVGVRIDIGCGEFVPPCPEYMFNGVRSSDVCRDALAMIQQLEAQNDELVMKTEQLQRERDALLEDLADHCGSKTLCKKYKDGTCPHGYDCTLYLSNCEDYEWRGVPEKEEEHEVDSN